MNHNRFALASICLVAALVAAGEVSSTFAQRPAPPERRTHPGKYSYWSNQRASRSLRHARDYSRDLYAYSRGVEKVSPELAKQESTYLGQNIEMAKKELATVRKDAGDDKEVLAALEAIEKHLAKAAEVHKSLHAECCKDAVDGTICAECCDEITKALDHALAEQAALMRKLEYKPQAAEKKEGQ